jgi:hypothetical protein
LPDRFIGKIARLPAESGRFGPPPDPLLCPIDLSAKAVDYRSSPADFFPVAADSVRRPPRLRAPADLSAKSADYPPKQADFCPVAAESLSPRPPLAPLSTGPNGERRIHCSAELGRPNTIYMSSGSSGPIFIFLIQFEFYPTKRSIFGNFSPPMFLEFHLVFLHIFQIFLFFQIFQIWISNIDDFKNRSRPIPPNFDDFQKNRPIFLTLPIIHFLGRQPIKMLGMAGVACNSNLWSRKPKKSEPEDPAGDIPSSRKASTLAGSIDVWETWPIPG